MTPKQVLLAHIQEHHTTQANRSLKRRPTLADLKRWHSRQHHRVWTNHYHAGPNTGPSERPPGWFTGEDVVVIR